MKHHLEISLPGSYLPNDIRRNFWIKGDMIYAVSLERLDLYRLDRNSEGKRLYYYDRIDNRLLFEIRKAVGHAIGLHFT